MRDLVTKATQYKAILSTVVLIIPLISATATAGWWAYNNMVFRPDINELKTDLTKEIIRVNILTLKIRKSQLNDTKAIYEEAITNISALENPTFNDIFNKQTFETALRNLENEIEDIDADIGTLSSKLHSE